MKTIFLAGAAAAAVLTTGVAVAQVAQPAPHAPRAHQMQAQTRAAVQAMVAKHFAKLDANRDGFITKAEADARQAQRAAKMQQRAGKRADRRDPSKMFDRLDANHDGQITQAEVQARHAERM